MYIHIIYIYIYAYVYVYKYDCICVFCLMQPGSDTCPIKGPGHVIEWARYKGGRPSGAMSKIARQTILRAFKSTSAEEKWKEIENDGIDGRVHKSFKATCALLIRIQRGEDPTFIYKRVRGGANPNPC